MATSGTVAKTVIDTSTLLEHAFRRVKVAPSAQTPETEAYTRGQLQCRRPPVGCECHIH